MVTAVKRSSRSETASISYLLHLEMPVHVRVEEWCGAGLVDGEPVPGGGLDVDDPPSSDIHQVVAVAD